MIENLTHDEAIILGILGQFENPVLRTKIVKLVFLLRSDPTPGHG